MATQTYQNLVFNKENNKFSTLLSLGPCFAVKVVICSILLGCLKSNETFFKGSDPVIEILQGPFLLE